MILSIYVEVNVSTRNIRDIKKYFSNVKLGDQVSIPVSLLSNGSHVVVKVKCDICGFEKNLSYQKYIKNIIGGYYSCSSKCSQNKVKETSIERYGKEYFSQTEEYKIFSIKTNNERYGNDYYVSSDIGKENISKIMNDKYGYSNPFNSEDIQNNIKKIWYR